MKRFLTLFTSILLLKRYVFANNDGYGSHMWGIRTMPMFMGWFWLVLFLFIILLVIIIFLLTTRKK